MIKEAQLGRSEATPGRRDRSASHPSLRWQIGGTLVPAALSVLLLACSSTEPVAPNEPQPTRLPPAGSSQPATPVPEPSLPPTPRASQPEQRSYVMNSCPELPTQVLVLDKEGATGKTLLYLNNGTDPDNGRITYTVRGWPPRSETRSVHKSISEDKTWRIIMIFDNQPGLDFVIDGGFGQIDDYAPRVAWSSQMPPLPQQTDITYTVCWQDGRINGATLNDGPVETRGLDFEGRNPTRI